jgi:hypothetical protein
MAVKTKRSSVRTALLAAASLAALARGANAAIDFVADFEDNNSGGGAAFAYSQTVTYSDEPCEKLIFRKTDGQLMAYSAYVAAVDADASAEDDYEAGRAKGPETDPGGDLDFSDCLVEAGYYLHTPAGAVDNGAALIVEEAPKGWYAVGGETLLNAGGTAVGTAAGSLGEGDSNDKITICAADTFNAVVAQVSQTACISCPDNSNSAVGSEVCETDAGYYLKTAAASATDMSGLVIKQAPANWYSAGGIAVTANTVTDVEPEDLDADSDSNPTNDIVRCPFSGTSEAGSSAVTSCTPDCSSLDVAVSDADGTTALGAGVGIQLVDPPSTGTLSDCETAPGFYLREQADGALDETSLKIQKAPANYYAPGEQNVVNGNVHDVGPDGTMAADGTNNLVTACPFSGTSKAGSDAVTKCTPDCSSLTVAVSDTDGTTALGAGVGIQNIVGATTGKLGDCETAPGFYLRVAATNADTPGSLEIQKAPANYYAPGHQNVVDGNEHDVGPDGTMEEDSNTPKSVTACPFAGTTVAAGSTARTDCTPDCSTTNSDSGAVASSGTCYCSAGTYGTPADASSVAVGAAKTGCTKCSVTFSSATAAGITSALGSTVKDNCKTAPGYLIDSLPGVPEDKVTVLQAPAGSYAAGGSSLYDTSGPSTLGGETATACPANSNSIAGSAFCTCDDGYIPAMGGLAECQPFDFSVAATAAAVAESAGASTPIAVALAAAAAVPLLL